MNAAWQIFVMVSFQVGFLWLGWRAKQNYGSLRRPPASVGDGYMLSHMAMAPTITIMNIVLTIRALT
jgi:hypothetical protein